MLVAWSARPVTVPATIFVPDSPKRRFEPPVIATETVLEELPLTCVADLAGTEVFWSYRSTRSFVLPSRSCWLPGIDSPQYIVAIGTASADDLSGAGYIRSLERGRALAELAQQYLPDAVIIVVVLGRERLNDAPSVRDSELYQTGRPAQLLQSSNRTLMAIENTPLRASIEENLTRAGLLDRYEYCVLLETALLRDHPSRPLRPVQLHVRGADGGCPHNPNSPSLSRFTSSRSLAASSNSRLAAASRMSFSRPSMTAERLPPAVR